MKFYENQILKRLCLYTISERSDESLPMTYLHFTCGYMRTYSKDAIMHEIGFMHTEKHGNIGTNMIDSWYT